MIVCRILHVEGRLPESGVDSTKNMASTVFFLQFGVTSSPRDDGCARNLIPSSMQVLAFFLGLG